MATVAVQCFIILLPRAHMRSRDKVINRVYCCVVIATKIASSSVLGIDGSCK